MTPTPSTSSTLITDVTPTAPDLMPGEQHVVPAAQVDPVLTPVTAMGDELQILAEHRVKPVRHPDRSIPISCTRCR